MVSRFLVTTALEETWPGDDVPILFLGEWCRLYNRKSVWEKRDAIVAPYHWDDRKKLYSDYLYLQTLYEELLSELAIKLNVLHGVNHSIRYWRIIVGPWLGYFIQMLFDRWAMLRQVVRDNDLSGVRVLQISDECLVPIDMADFNLLFLSDAWNEAICGQLLAWMKISTERVDALDDALVSTSNVTKLSFSRKAKRALVQVASHISSALCRDNEYFFISSYLPRKQDLLLQFKLGQVPKLWRLVAVPITPANRSMRQWQMPEPENTDNFSSIARAMIPRHIPTAYLEGYRDVADVVEKLPWPKRPKAIFTSNSYNSDDVFKTWAAGKVEGGTPLVIGQHGGGHGTHLWGFYEEHQIAICDTWISWGWVSKKNLKIKPIGNLKMMGLDWKCDPEGGALMVEMELPRYSYHMYSVPVASQWLDYFEEQHRFVAALPLILQRQLLVRLYSNDYGWNQKQRWKDRLPNICLDDGVIPIKLLIKKSRLFISTYNATTFLESLAMNIPTIMFWNPKHWELNDDAIPYYEQLKVVGILHETPESAAKQMIRVWDEISAWWDSVLVQSTRKEFCHRYSRTPERPLESLGQVLRQITVTT